MKGNYEKNSGCNVFKLRYMLWEKKMKKKTETKFLTFQF